MQPLKKATWTYIQRIAGAGGADTLLTVNLTINTVDTAVTSGNETLTANSSGATYQWIDCDNGNAISPNETNQSFTATVSGNYAVVVTENNCSDSSSCYYIMGVGVTESNFNSKLAVFPNPFSDRVTIDLGAKYEDEYVVVQSVKGEKILSANYKTEQKFELSMETLPSGIYMVHVSSGDNLATLRLVKK